MNLKKIESDLRESAKKRELLYTKHALEKMELRKISPQEVREALSRGEIIEFYEEDLPFPSCLVLGFTERKRALHLVCSIPPEVWVITAYEPDPERWVEYRKRR